MMDGIVRLRPGRLKNTERDMILERLGEIAQNRYKDNIEQNSQGYNLLLIKYGLKFHKNIQGFFNYYYIDNESEELDQIARFFEYGTGIYNTETRDTDFIKPKHYKHMKFVGTKGFFGVMIFTKKVKGVRPIMMFQKTILSLEQNKDNLQRQIRLELGI